MGMRESKDYEANNSLTLEIDDIQIEVGERIIAADAIVTFLTDMHNNYYIDDLSVIKTDRTNENKEEFNYYIPSDSEYELLKKEIEKAAWDKLLRRDY